MRYRNEGKAKLFEQLLYMLTNLSFVFNRPTSTELTFDGCAIVSLFPAGVTARSEGFSLGGPSFTGKGAYLSIR